MKKTSNLAIFVSPFLLSLIFILTFFVAIFYISFGNGSFQKKVMAGEFYLPDYAVTKDSSSDEKVSMADFGLWLNKYRYYKRNQVLPPVNSLSLSEISYREYVACGIGSEGKGYCWGEAMGSGIYGDGIPRGYSPIPLPVSQGERPAGITFTSIGVGAQLACGIGSDGNGYCWGKNYYGGLGNGTTVASNVPVLVGQGERPAGVTFTSIGVGNAFACGLGSDGNGYCWGYNRYGELGNGTEVHSNVPVLVSQGERPAGVTFTSISVESFATCGIGSDGNGYCWGWNDYGGLGNGTTVDSNVPVLVSQGERPAGVTLASISAGYWTSCGIGSDGNGYCWGLNSSGALGNGTEVASNVPVLVSQGERPAGVTLASISVGKYNTCGLGSDGNGYCWGLGSQGELGNGLEDSSNVPVLVIQGERPAGVTFTSISVGESGACGIGSDGKSYCWGREALGSGKEPSTICLFPCLLNTQKTPDFNNDGKVSMEDFGEWLDIYRKYKSFDQGSYKVAYWPLDESVTVSGSFTEDVVGFFKLYSSLSTESKAIEIVPGKKENGAMFNNEQEYRLEIQNNINSQNQFFDDQDFTVMAYIKKSADTCGYLNHCSIISKGSSGNAGFNFATQNGKLKFYINDSPDVDNKHALGNTILENNIWYHVAGSYNSEDGSLKVYVNGILDGSGTNAGPIKHTYANFTIGNANDNLDLQFNGVIDEVRFFDKVLTQEEIASYVLP